MPISLRTSIAGVELENPTVLASGIWGTSADVLKRALRNGAGAVTTKSIGPEPREGHRNPSVVDFGYGIINAVGLPSPGYRRMHHEFESLSRIKKPVIWSIYGNKAGDFERIAKHIMKYGPKMIELNISCPNKENGMLFSQDKRLARSVTRRVKEAVGKTPVVSKLSPNVANITEIAIACEQGGADALTVTNTAQGMIIDIEAKQPVLHYKRGGISGPALKPIAVRCVYDIYGHVKIPIIGTGGVVTGRDAIEMIQAGASAVGIGSGVYYRGIDVFRKVVREMEVWMKANKYRSLEELVGIAHDWRKKGKRKKSR